MQDRFRYRFWNGKYICFFDIFRSFYLMELVDEKKLPVMQCTGLKDKNGNLIYEGDIINDKSDHIRVCVYEYDMFRYPALKTSRYFHKAIKNKKCNRCEGLLSKLTFQDNLSKKDKSEFEVIGNIYENPELLESEEK